MMAKESKLPAPYNKSEEANKQTANGVGRTRQRAIKIAEAKTIQTYAGAEPPKASSRLALIFYCYYPVYPMFMHTQWHSQERTPTREHMFTYAMVCELVVAVK